jgi:hypothetical protein
MSCLLFLKVTLWRSRDLLFIFASYYCSQGFNFCSIDRSLSKAKEFKDKYKLTVLIEIGVIDFPRVVGAKSIYLSV